MVSYSHLCISWLLSFSHLWGDVGWTRILAFCLAEGATNTFHGIRHQVDHKEKLIYVDELIYKSNNSTDDLIKLVGAKVDKRTLIIADSASPRTIDDINGNGYNIHKVDKPKIIDSVKVLQGYRIIVTENSMNIIRELNDWVWLDKKGEIPADCNNHSIDAIRYAVTMLVKPPTNFKGVRVLKRN